MKISDGYRQIIDLRATGYTWRAIATKLNKEGVPSLSGQQWTRDAVRNIYRRRLAPGSVLVSVAAAKSSATGSTIQTIDVPRTERARQDVIPVVTLGEMGNVLVIPDTHEPFSLNGFAEWCADVRDRYGCDTVVHIGDLVDNYASSQYPKDPDNPGSLDEWENTLARLRVWYKLFPEVILTLGNHDDRPLRTAKAGGLSGVFMRSFREVWEIPDRWTICQEAVIDGVLYTHQGGGGQNPSLSRALAELIPVVSGHYHTVAGVVYHSGRKHTLWGMNVGCGIDRTGYGIAYSQTIKGFIHGCGVVIRDGGRSVPHFIPFEG